MIRRDWNHPSIILWGVRINESKDDHDFYVRTNALAHGAPPHRMIDGWFQSRRIMRPTLSIATSFHGSGPICCQPGNLLEHQQSDLIATVRKCRDCG